MGNFKRVRDAVGGVLHLSKVDLEDSYIAESVTGAVTVDFLAAKVHKLTLTGNITPTLTGAVSGTSCRLTLVLTQDATGSRTVTWSGVKWASGTVPTLSTAAGATDVVVLESHDGGITWFGNLFGKGYA